MNEERMQQDAAKRARWEKLYGGQERLHEIFREPYVNAVAPIVAGVVDFQGKSKLRVLVIGGGKGRFTKDLLPKVQEALAEKGNHAEIDVVETDFNEVVKEAPAKKRVRADMWALPFRSGSFDLVVGQSVMHQGGPRRLPQLISEVRRVLTPKGSFVHVADHVPDPRDWTGAGLLGADVFPGEVPTRKATERSEKEALIEVSLEAHRNLIDFFRLSAGRNDMSSATVNVNHESVVPITGPRNEAFGGVKTRKANSWLFQFGRLSGKDEKGIPRGMRKVAYSGFVNIATLHPRVSEIIRHIERRGFAKEG